MRNGLGERFMERYAPTIKDLAARDVVSRAILTEVREGRGIGGKGYVHLDLTHLGEQKIREKLWEIASFARIYLGIDPRSAAHSRGPHVPLRDGRDPTDADGRVLADGNRDRGRRPLRGGRMRLRFRPRGEQARAATRSSTSSSSAGGAGRP